jgi:antitoxin (DNA-binding transcriptional repressor) of toxin-antitoxin stability system
MKVTNPLEQTIGTFEMRQGFSRFVDEVARDRKKFVIEKHGRSVAAVVPMEIYNQWKRERRRLLDLMRKASKTANLDEETALRIALDAQQEVRAKHRSKI